MNETLRPATGCPAPAILVAEDDALVRESLMELLGELAMPVFAATDGVEAMAVLDDRPEITVLVTDMMMPRMGGLELAAAARRRRPGLRVLFLSGLLRPPAGEQFLAKPVAAGALISIVERLAARA